MSNFTLLHQLQNTRRFFDGYVLIATVHVVEIDEIDVKTVETLALASRTYCASPLVVRLPSGKAILPNLVASTYQ